MKISIQRIGSHDLPLPKQETEGAAGFDLRSTERVTMYAGDRAIINTGFAWTIPPGHCGQIWPRSGLAVKKGIQVMAGMIDPDFIGEIAAVLYNSGYGMVEICPGDRVAQLVIAPYIKGQTVEVESLAESERGAGGFGSTGAR